MHPDLSIVLATADNEIAACYPVMRELRPHLEEATFVARIRQQMAQGYHLAAVWVAGEVVAVTGFRVSENLAWGRFLYVDDLVTCSDCRSCGYGAALLTWLKKQAVAERCDQLHLDSGVWRKDAHRFYEREGMRLSSFHFVWDVPATA
ncbi:GNAT family N-acetyltransferase [Chloroflexus sp.]|uniref:GNAT family N-acetyltransferase n=1 Tax=Chloroflexus sp. TaxID=1904827 RepID=UPI0026285F15|nr:GNAT family N-acetyltransferase [uncultured Chloroflexus sp.]